MNEAEKLRHKQYFCAEKYHFEGGFSTTLVLKQKFAAFISQNIFCG
jgi:hypothetical protein